MALLPKPPSTPIDQFGDKFEHTLAFCMLAGIGWGAFPKLPLRLLAERLSFFGAVIELLQSIPALHRDCSVADWLTDTGAIVVVLAVAGAGRRLRSTRARSDV